MKKILLLLLIINNAIFANYDEGIEYIKLDPPIKTSVSDKIEVRELFWYYCSHCYNLEPFIENWLKNKPNNVEFIRQPAVFSKRWAQGAIFYYTLEELNLINKLHKKLFEAIHKNKITFNSKEKFINWVASFNLGINKTKIAEALNSFAVHIKLNKSVINTNKYKINGVPAIIVNGKYLVNTTTAGSHQKIIKVVNYLIEQENK